MKKFAKVFAMIAVVVCLGATMMACGERGTYVYSGEIAGQTMEISLELKSGGKFVQTVKTTVLGVESTKSEEGVYEIDGDKITLKKNADDKVGTVGTIKKGVITIDLTGAGTKVEFKKK